jgi:FAD:protein FMN transferase
VSVQRFRSMGCEIVVAGGEPARVAGVFARWDQAFSLFRPESELTKVNASAAPVLRVSPLFAKTFSCALEAAFDTGGLVDPTVGARTASRLGEARLEGLLLFRPPGLRLDLNGVVKALAVGEAVATLAGEGFVSAGGDLAVRGPVDVGLPGGDAVRVVRGGLATSGIVSRGHHLIDPRTGRPSTSPWAQVTVSGASCLAADVAAKAAFLLGPDGPRWLDERGMAGRFIAADGEVVLNEAWQGEVVCI